MTVGRLVLSFLTSRLGEFTSVLIYLGLTLGLELIFWLVPSFIVSVSVISRYAYYHNIFFAPYVFLPRPPHQEPNDIEGLRSGFSTTG